MEECNWLCIVIQHVGKLKKLGLVGYVMNESDGTVKIVAEGQKENWKNL